jgi:hypothetical protein
MTRVAGDVGLKAGAVQRANHAHTRQLHEARTAVPAAPTDEEALARAEHQLQLYWLRTLPGYRELVKARVSEAAKRAEKLSRRIDYQHEDVDYLGREVEGCG